MSEPTNYLALMQQQDPWGIRQYGYTVKLEKDGNFVVMNLFYDGNSVGRTDVPILKDGDYRQISEIVYIIRQRAMEFYDRHNKTLNNPTLLKELEDRLNGVETEMLVLRPAEKDVEDTPGMIQPGEIMGIGIGFRRLSGDQ